MYDFGYHLQRGSHCEFKPIFIIVLVHSVDRNGGNSMRYFEYEKLRDRGPLNKS